MNIKLMYLFCLVVFVASVSGVMSIAYQTSDLKSQLSDIKREIGTLTQFKADVYVDKFYPDCLECQKEKKEIIDKDTITTKK